MTTENNEILGDLPPIPADDAPPYAWKAFRIAIVQLRVKSAAAVEVFWEALKLDPKPSPARDAAKLAWLAAKARHTSVIETTTPLLDKANDLCKFEIKTKILNFKAPFDTSPHQGGAVKFRFEWNGHNGLDAPAEAGGVEPGASRALRGAALGVRVNVSGECDTPLRKGMPIIIRAPGEPVQADWEGHRYWKLDKVVVEVLPAVYENAIARHLKHTGVSDDTAKKIAEMGHSCFADYALWPDTIPIDFPRLQKQTHAKIEKAANLYNKHPLLRALTQAGFDHKPACLLAGVKPDEFSTPKTAELAEEDDLDEDDGRAKKKKGLWHKPRDIVRNPYCLAEEHEAIGSPDLSKMDKLWDILYPKIPHEQAPGRPKGAVIWAAHLYSNGSTGIERSKFYDLAGHGLTSVTIDQGIEDARKHLVFDTWRGLPCVFLKPSYAREHRIAATMLGIINRRKDRASGKFAAVTTKQMLSPQEAEARLKAAVEDMTAQGTPPTNEQISCIMNVFRHEISCLTGGPGTGKTTIIKLLAQIAGPDNVIGCSYSNLASRKLAAVAGIKAVTVHALVQRLVDGSPYPTGTDAFGGELPRTCFPLMGKHILVIEEASCISLKLLEWILDEIEEVNPSVHIVFVGDCDQLPPIEDGAPFRDLIDSGIVPVERLTKIHRFDDDLAHVARMFLECDEAGLEDYVDEEEDVDNPKSVRFVDRVSLEHLAPILRSEPNLQALGGAKDSSLALAGDPLSLRNRSLGTRDINDAARKANPNLIGARVILTGNTDDGCNGERGTIVEECQLTNDKGQLYDGIIIDIDGRRVRFPLSITNDGPAFGVAWAWCLTVHKAQGSEFDTVYLFMSPHKYPLHTRSLLYTGLTRARTRCIVVGTLGELIAGLRSRAGSRRITKLGEFLNPDKDWGAFKGDADFVSNDV
jgi:energy-coupling factor transporter ATP-binding protein EcfA2